jgi:hypothetical protein
VGNCWNSYFSFLNKIAHDSLNKAACRWGVRLYLCFFNWMAYWGSGGTAPPILDLSTRWMCLVSFTPPPLYPKVKSPWYPLDRRLGGPQRRSGRGGLEKNSQPPPGIEPQNPDRPARSPALYELSYHGSRYESVQNHNMEAILRTSGKDHVFGNESKLHSWRN